ncbi:MAG: MCE family protein [Marmoricola sp.]
MSARKRLLAALAGFIGLVLVTGCGPTMADLPLPGNGVSGDTIKIKVRFDEALNLAQGAAVKVNGVNEGKVRSVTTANFKAIATLEVRKSAHVREDASARLRYTTPLGELFVDVTNPVDGTLVTDGGTLDPKRSTTAPTVEDALSSASLLVNGGGLNQLQTVTDQLNAALGGREDTVRELLGRANTFLDGIDASTGDIDRALRALAAFSKIANQNRATIRAALHDIQPAARVLRENTPDFTALLAKLAEFSGTANDVVLKTRTQILQMVREVSPVLQEFLDNTALLGPSLRALVNVSNTLNGVVPGDYLSLKLGINLAGVKLPSLLGAGSGSGGLLGGLTGLAGKTSTTNASSSPIGLTALLGGAR